MDTDSEFDEMMMTKVEEPKLEDIIYDLEVKKMNLINSFNYLEADKLQIEIDKYKKRRDFKERKDIEILHLNELKSLEEQFKVEMETALEEFNKRFLELEKASKTWESELDMRHKQEVAKLTKDISEQAEVKFKCNKEYMNLVKQEELLVKSLKLKEAHIVKVKREKLLKQNEEEAKKLEKTQTSIQKNRFQYDKLEKRQNQEKDMLKARIEREIDKIKKEKSAYLEQLHHKYKNKKLNLENNYKKEVSIIKNPVRAKSSTYKIPKLKNNSSVFSKISSLDNYSVHNTNHSKSLKGSSYQPEKINVNLNSVAKNTNSSANNNYTKEGENLNNNEEAAEIEQERQSGAMDENDKAGDNEIRLKTGGQKKTEKDVVE